MKFSNHPRSKRRNGFSLLEVLIALGISTTVLAIVTPASIFILRGSYSLVAHSEQGRQMNVAANRLGDDIRMARDFTIVNASQINVDRIDGASYNYYLSNVGERTDLIRENRDSGEKVTLITSVSSFTLSTPGTSGKRVQIDIALETEIRGGVNATEALSFQFTQRN